MNDTCTRCNGIGHSIQVCTSVAVQVVCKECGEQGHLTRACPTQARASLLASLTASGVVRDCQYCGGRGHDMQHCASKTYKFSKPSPLSAAPIKSVPIADAGPDSATEAGCDAATQGRRQTMQTDATKRARSDSTSMPPPELVCKRARVNEPSRMLVPQPPPTTEGGHLTQEFERISHELKQTQQLEAEITRRFHTLEGARTINRLNQHRLIDQGKAIRDSLAQVKHDELSLVDQVKQRAVIAACKQWEKLK